MIDYQQLAGQMEAAGVHARLQEPLSRHTTFRIGGPARLFCLPASENGLIAALELCRAAGCRTLPLWQALDELIAGYLDGVSVADLAAASRPAAP